jgi:hypothetical protein
VDEHALVWQPALVVDGVTSYIAGPKAGLTFKQPLGKPDTLTFALDGDDPIMRLLVELQTDIELWVGERDSLLPSVLKFRGRLVALDDDADEGYTVALTAQAYSQLLHTRMLPTDVAYSAVPQGDLVWALVQLTQAQVSGDLGITAGDLVSAGQVRDKTAPAGTYIGKIVDDLSDNINGYDWWIDEERRLQVRTPRRGDTLPLVLSHPGNVAKAHRKSAASQFRNVDRETGDEPTVPYVATVGLPDPRGRWEVSNANSKVVEQANLVAKANGNLARSATPRATWTVELQAGVWGGTFITAPGDVLRFQFRRGHRQFDGLCRIVEQAFSVGQNGATRVTMALTEE